jgi:hypothetical protein
LPATVPGPRRLPQEREREEGEGSGEERRDRRKGREREIMDRENVLMQKNTQWPERSA